MGLSLFAMGMSASGRVMTVRGFLKGMTPIDESLTAAAAHIEDAAGHTDSEKLGLYVELEVIAKQVVERLEREAAG